MVYGVRQIIRVPLGEPGVTPLGPDMIVAFVALFATMVEAICV